jgi:hypothetical protein
VAARVYPAGPSGRIDKEPDRRREALPDRRSLRQTQARTAPISASAGKTTGHLLHRRDDRQLVGHRVPALRANQAATLATEFGVFCELPDQEPSIEAVSNAMMRGTDPQVPVTDFEPRRHLWPVDGTTDTDCGQ